MAQVTGVVQVVKDKQTSIGKTAWDIKVGGQWYGAGLFKPDIQEGDYVSFDYVVSGNFKNIERGTLKKGKVPEGSAAKAVNSAMSNFDTRQDAISRQAASNTAIAWVTFLASNGAIQLPARSKGAAQEGWDTILAEYERRFYEKNTGVRWKDISPAPAKAGGARADSEDSNDDHDMPDDVEWM